MIYHDIVPYTEKKLDCYQNMLVTLLHHYGYDVDLLGAVLPWRYYFRKQTNEITNWYIASDNIVASLYGCHINRRKFSSGKIYDTLLQETAERPVIVNVDQYYVPHHYVHIYRKQHGQHSLIINGYDESERAFYCVDAFPQYTGKISCDELITGIMNFPYDYLKLEYSFIVKVEDLPEKRDEIFLSFLSSVNAYKNSPEDRVFSNAAIISILDSINTKDDELFFHKLQDVFRGNWIWELDRVADWTISYLNKDHVRRMVGNEKVCLLSDLIRQCNTGVTLAYRLMYKSLINKSRDTFAKGYEKLKDMIILQDEIYRLIRNIQHEIHIKIDVREHQE